jgi:hypothetical protein
MKRRSFIRKTTLISGGILFAGGILAKKNLDLHNAPPEFNKELLEKELTEYYEKLFNVVLDLNELPDRKRITLADSFEIEVNNKKNNIFDVADSVIEKLKPLGYDAKPLLEGKIPEGMKIGSGNISVNTDKKLIGIEIPELKNYDAKLVLKNPLLINYRVKPTKLVNEIEYELVSSNDIHDSYRGKKYGTYVSKPKENSYYYISVKSVSPVKIDYSRTPNFIAVDKKANAIRLSPALAKIL